MNCPKCGKVIGDTDKFCTACGESISPKTNQAVASKKQSPDLAAIIKKSFSYPWKHKAFIFYGVLLAIFGGYSGGSSNWSLPTAPSSDLPTPSVNVPVILFVTLVVILVLALFSIIAGWALSAIIKGTVAVENGEQITRKMIGKTGREPVWGLIKLYFLIPFGIFLIALLILTPVVLLLMALGQAGMVVGVILFILLIIALIPVLVYFGIIWFVAARYVALENKKVFESISSARKLIKGSFWITFLYSFISGVISGLGGCVGSIVFVIFLIATIGLIAVQAYIAAVITGVLTFAGFIILLIVAGYFRAFQETGYTLWWLDLKKIKG